jgi:hypothetical protein
VRVNSRFVLGSLFLVACAATQEPETTPPRPAPVAAPEPAPAAEPATAVVAEAATAEPAPAPAPVPEPAPAPEAPAPAAPVVSVNNIGLHVGGGPNDAATKAPFLKALAGAFPDFERCGALAPEGKREGTFGIDLLVPRGGGTAETSNARTAIPGDVFRDCVTKAFASVVFAPPKRGATKLSYALRFSRRR